MARGRSNGSNGNGTLSLLKILLPAVLGALGSIIVAWAIYGTQFITEKEAKEMADERAKVLISRIERLERDNESTQRKTEEASSRFEAITVELTKMNGSLDTIKEKIRDVLNEKKE